MKFRDAIEEVRSRADIVEIIGAQVQLKKAGRNFKGLCPFHGEKTPSFVVSPDKQIYHCFGCGAGGSVYDFVMNFRNLSFAEALEFLASRVGITIEQDDNSAQAGSMRKHRQSLTEVNLAAARFFHRYLLSEAGSSARQYLAGRGIDAQAIEQFRLGLAPRDWDNLASHLAKADLSLAGAAELGLITEKRSGQGKLPYYDRFRHQHYVPDYEHQG